MPKDTRKLYFAYGSNMNQERLESRVGKVERLGVFKLYRYVLVFNAGDANFGRFANLCKTGLVKDYTEGVIYKLTTTQVITLDKYEGAPEAYNRVIEKIRIPKLGVRSIIVYIDINESYIHKDSLVPIQREYLNHLIAGCTQNDLKFTRNIITKTFGI